MNDVHILLPEKMEEKSDMTFITHLLENKDYTEVLNIQSTNHKFQAQLPFDNKLITALSLLGYIINIRSKSTDIKNGVYNELNKYNHDNSEDTDKYIIVDWLNVYDLHKPEEIDTESASNTESESISDDRIKALKAYNRFQRYKTIDLHSHNLQSKTILNIIQSVHNCMTWSANDGLYECTYEIKYEKIRKFILQRLKNIGYNITETNDTLVIKW
jgi:hypothetical protein